jgi:hypothetical protein
MKSSRVAAFLAGCGLASAYPGVSLWKRWDYDMCDCTMSGVPLPDEANFQLPLENLYQEQCPPIYLGEASSPQATSKVCLDFVGTNLQFTFSPFPGYTTESASVTWKLKGNHGNPATWTSPPPDLTLDCVQAPGGGDFVCKLPFNEILSKPGTTSAKDLMSGMCPNGDREGLVFYFQFSGTVAEITDPAAIAPFQGRPPCTTRSTDRQCTAWDDTYDYIEVSYRCSKCEHAVCPPPPVVSCKFGTAFGFQTDPTSFTLNTQSGQGCNRWGWYQTPTLAALQSGISGPLFVGSNPNTHVNVGTWFAFANAVGGITVTYLLNPPYTLGSVHVDLACLPIDKCAPGDYTYKADNLPEVPVWSNPTPIQYPRCSGGSKAGLIIHADINILTVGTCPAT